MKLSRDIRQKHLSPAAARLFFAVMRIHTTFRHISLVQFEGRVKQRFDIYLNTETKTGVTHAGSERGRGSR